MKDLGHGANVDNMAKQFGKDEKDIIDFSSNVNPHIISNLGKYVLEGLEKSRSYPDINYTNLRNNISEYINVDSELIIPGNGATEIIYLLMKSIKKRIAILNSSILFCLANYIADTRVTTVVVFYIIIIKILKTKTVIIVHNNHSCISQ